MKNNKLPIILVSISCLLFIVAIVLVLNIKHFEFSNQTSNKETNSNQLKEETSEKEDNKETIKEENTTSNNSTNSDSNKVESNKENNPTDTNQNVDDTKEEIPVVDTNQNISNNKDETNSVEITNDEKVVVAYFAEQDNNIVAGVDQDNRTLREKAKDSFVTVVDFIFYDKEIKGYTFAELTNSAKIQIIKIALSIDNKIDEYFPDYKDVIKDKYHNIKGKLAVKYLEFTSTLCEKVGENTCNQAKEDFNAMKKSFGFTWELIKELASSGSQKVKDFYESWRDSE